MNHLLKSQCFRSTINIFISIIIYEFQMSINSLKLVLILEYLKGIFKTLLCIENNNLNNSGMF